MTRRFAVLAMYAATLTWAGCTSTGPEGPDPGAIVVSLTSPNSNDGGVRFLVSGGPIDSVTAGTHDVFQATVDDGARIIVIGSLVPSGIALLWIPDRRNIDDYEFVLEEVAASGTFANRSLSGYSLTVGIP